MSEERVANTDQFEMEIPMFARNEAQAESEFAAARAFGRDEWTRIADYDVAEEGEPDVIPSISSQQANAMSNTIHIDRE